MLSSLAGRDGPRSRRGSVRVLVVDDSSDLAGLVAMWLEDEGYAVVTATSGREALDAASVYYPDIVVLDEVTAVLYPNSQDKLMGLLVSSLRDTTIGSVRRGSRRSFIPAS